MKKRNLFRALHQRSFDTVYYSLSWSQQGSVLVRSGIEPIPLKRYPFFRRAKYRIGTKREKSAELSTSSSCGDLRVDTGREVLRRWMRGQINWPFEKENTNKAKRSAHDYCTSHVLVHTPATSKNSHWRVMCGLLSLVFEHLCLCSLFIWLAWQSSLHQKR